MIQLKEKPIDGQIIRMGGLDIVVPSLNLRQIKLVAPEIKKMEREKDDEKRLAAQVRIIHQGLRRNYPDITTEDVEDLVDMGNLLRIMAAVMGQKYQDGDEGKIAPATL